MKIETPPKYLIFLSDKEYRAGATTVTVLRESRLVELEM